MTPEKAMEVFWKAYEEASDQSRFNNKPLVQSTLYQAGFEKLLSEIDKEWAERYLSMQDSLKTINWQIKEGYLSPHDRIAS